MKEYMLLFRRNAEAEQKQMSSQEFQRVMKQWQDWTASLTQKGKFSGAGKRLAIEGAVLKPNSVVTNGPYVETKETLVGYAFIHADSLDEAKELAKGCPNISMGGSVEVRAVWSNDREG